MTEVAEFGNAGGGKSMLARRLAELTGLLLHVVDMMQFRPGGAKVPLADPPGWPENGPLWSRSLQSCRVLWLCRRHLTPKYRQLVAEEAASKGVHHLRSPGPIDAFLKGVKKERLNP